MELNKVHHLNFLDNTLPDKCAQLIIADPPYFEVKGDFDFIWKSFDDYLKYVEKWAIECKRLLSDNGTLLWYGDSKKIAYSQIIIDRHLNLLSNITINIIDRQTNKIKPEDARCFINTSESLLMYDKLHKSVNLYERVEYELFLRRVSIMKPIIEYLNKARVKSGKSISDINLFTKTKMGSIWFTHPSQWQLPTKDWYIKLVEFIGEDFMNKSYEQLKEQYDTLDMLVKEEKSVLLLII